MLYKLLNENIQNILDNKICNIRKTYFKIVLNELKYKYYYNKCYLSNNKCSIFINNYNIGWCSLTTTTNPLHKIYYIYIIYGNVNKKLTTINELLFKKKKLLLIQQIYKWNIKKFLSYKINF